MFEIEKMYGFYVPALKGNTDNDHIKGIEIRKTKEPYNIIKELFDVCKEKCDIEIKFTYKLEKNGDKSQINNFHEKLTDLNNDYSYKNALWFAQKLSSVTDNTAKDGLFFMIKGKENDIYRYFLCRIPAEVGITVNQNQEKIDFSVKDDVFIKNSRKYKAVYFDSCDEFYIGFITDKQIKDNNETLKSVSNYWILDFLESEINLTSKRGSRQIAEAIRKTIQTTDDKKVVAELTCLAPQIGNINKKMTSFENFFDLLNLSDNTKREVLKKMQGENTSIQFEIDSDEFLKHYSYKVIILDSGAIAIAPSEEFEETWTIKNQGNGEVNISAEGAISKTKITQKVY